MTKRSRKLLLAAVKLSIAVALLILVLSQVHWSDHQVGDDRQPGFRSSLMHVKLLPVVAGFLAFGLSQLTISVRWRLLLQVQNIPLSRLEAVRLTFLGLFFNNAVPGTVGGDLFKAYYAAQHTPRKAGAVIAVLMDRALGMTELALMATVMLVLSWALGLMPTEELTGPAIAVAVVLVILFLGMTFLLSRRFRRMLHLQRFYQRLPIAHHLAAAGKATGRYRRRPGKLVEAMGLSLLAHIFLVGSIYLLGVGLSLPTTWYRYFLAVPLIYTVGAVPITPGGLGLVEKLYLVFFAANPSQLLVLALMARLLPLAWGLPGLWVFLSGPRPPKAALIRHELELDGLGDDGTDGA